MYGLLDGTVRYVWRLAEIGRFECVSCHRTAHFSRNFFRCDRTKDSSQTPLIVLQTERAHSNRLGKEGVRPAYLYQSSPVAAAAPVTTPSGPFRGQGPTAIWGNRPATTGTAQSYSALRKRTALLDGSNCNGRKGREIVLQAERGCGHGMGHDERDGPVGAANPPSVKARLAHCEGDQVRCMPSRRKAASCAVQGGLSAG